MDATLKKPPKKPKLIKTPVKPVANAIGILRFLAEADEPVRASIIARSLSINPSTCFNILRTLVVENIVEFDESTKTYKVGYGLYQLTGGVVSEQKKLVAVKNILHQFAEENGVTATLWRAVGSNRMVLDIVEYSPNGIRVHMPAGQRMPIFMGATGRAAVKRLGFTKAEAKKKFDKLRWSRPLDFEEYWKDAELAAKRGWSRDDGYFSQGVMTVAIPIFDGSNALAYSLVAVTLREQIDNTEVEALAEDLKPIKDNIVKLLI